MKEAWACALCSMLASAMQQWRRATCGTVFRLLLIKEWDGPASRDTPDERLTEQSFWCRDNREASLGLCPLLAASICHPTTDMCGSGHSMVAALCNPLASGRTQGVRATVCLAQRLTAECRDNKAGSLGLCPLLNASVCHPTVEMSNLGHSMVAVLYNPLAWPRTEGVRIPINTSHSSSWTVTGRSPFTLGPESWLCQD